MKLGDVLDDFWHDLNDALKNPDAPWRMPALSTLRVSDGAPRTRTVVTRQANRAVKQIVVHTDRRSGKVAEIEHNPSASLMFYDHSTRKQLRLEGNIVFADEETRLADWAKLSEFGHINYGRRGTPGDAISNWDDFDNEGEGLTQFVVLIFRIETADWVWLDEKGHKRAYFDLVAGTSSWLVP